MSQPTIPSSHPGTAMPKMTSTGGTMARIPSSQDAPASDLPTLIREQHAVLIPMLNKLMIAGEERSVGAG